MSSDRLNGPPTPPAADPDTDSPDVVQTMYVPGGVRPVNPTDLTRTLPESAPDTPPPLPDIPGYDVLARLGAGGMGVVYHARQTTSGQDVALKLLLADPTDPTRGLARFLAEAEAAAAIRHPHVVRVYDFGSHAGHPYLTLEYLAGGTLADRIDTGRMPPADAARLVGKLARAVQAAHAAGIVHRDLKPANILFDAAGEPRVTDFGLAKRSSASITATRTVMGSPAYMPPEQARGEAKFIGPPADIWALGVILYECLTGARPFAGDSAEAVLRQVIAVDPPPLRAADPTVPRALDLVCRKCLEKNPQDRYASADDLADDLARFAAGEPVRVRPPGPVARLAKLARRDPHRAAAYALTATVIFLIVAATTITGLWRQADAARLVAVAAGAQLEGEKQKTEDALHRLAAEQERTRAERDAAEAAGRRAEEERALADAARRDADTQRTAAEAERDRARRYEYALLVASAYRDWQENDLAAARTLLEKCPTPFRGWEWRYAHRLCHADRLTLRAGRPLAAAVFSPDGKRVAAAEAGGTVRVWDAGTGAEVLTTGGRKTGRLWSVAFSPDGSRLVTAGGDGTARVWDAKTGDELAALRAAEAGTLLTAAFGPTGGVVVAAGGPGPAVVWDVKSGQVIRRFGGEPGKVVATLSAAFSPDGSKVATAATDGTVRVWDFKTGNQLAALEGQVVPTGVVFSPDGGQLAATGVQIDGRVVVWNVESGARVGSLPVTTEGHHAVAFGPGERLVTAGVDGWVRVWSTRTGREVQAIRVQRLGVRSVAISPDGKRVLTAEQGGAARVWEPSAPPPETPWPERDGGTKYLALSPDLDRAVVERGDKKVGLWDSRIDKDVVNLKTQPGIVTLAAFSPDGSMLATVGADGIVRAWDAGSGSELAALPAQPGGVSALVFRPDGSMLATASTVGAVHFWDVAARRERAELLWRAGSVRGLAFSADGRRTVTVGADGTVRVWDSGRREARRFDPAGPGDEFLAAALTPDGSRLITGSTGGGVRIWDVESGANVFSRDGTAGPVELVGFSRDGMKAAGGSRSGRVVVWDATPLNQPLSVGGTVAPPPDPAQR